MKTCLRGFANNNGADQPVQMGSLISSFVISLLEIIISRLATSEISIFKLVSVGEASGLSLVLFEVRKTGFDIWNVPTTVVCRPVIAICPGAKLAVGVEAADD